MELIFQNFQLLPNLTALERLCYGAVGNHCTDVFPESGAGQHFDTGHARYAIDLAVPAACDVAGWALDEGVIPRWESDPPVVDASAMQQS